MTSIFRHIVLILFILLGVTSFSQNSSIPPAYENTYLFSIRKYDRQPAPPKYMYNRIQQIHNNSTSIWTAADSLYYAYESVYLKKYGLALSIFSRLNTDTIQEPRAQSLYRLALHKKERYDALHEYNLKTIPKDEEKIYDVQDAFIDLNKAFKAREMGEFIQDSTQIFSILASEKMENIKRSKQPQFDEITQIAFAIDSVLRQYSILTDDRDVVLIRAFEEAGDLQMKYLYTTNAFFYYSAGRHFNKSNLELGEKYNLANNRMRDKNILAISYKSNFGKIVKNRYDFAGEKTEEIDTRIGDETSFIPPEIDKKKDYLPWISTTGWYLIVLFVVLLSVLIFLRTK